MMLKLSMTVLPWLVLLVGCGEAPSSIESVELVNAPLDASEMFPQVVELVAEFGGQVDLDTYTIYVYEDLKDSRQPCAGHAACTLVPAHRMYLPWLEGEDATNAATLAHELGHIYYGQTTGDSDPNHLHSEWFDFKTGDSVTLKVYDALSNGPRGRVIWQ